ncbi:unnamed protein product [Hymenolepis diminuta]|uniref:Uncharacterized protein n=1 Tax=Hymenolepis diminuta TaxID=6216 RepID=A0A564YGZ5_HYMDI|nr:unnamed protein product [Hymenolepis diminuta]
MEVWFPFGQSNSGADETNLQHRNAEENPMYKSTSRSSQLWGLVGKEIHEEVPTHASTASNTTPLMSAAAAAMAQSFFNREPIGSTNDHLNSLLNAAAVTNLQHRPNMRTEGFPLPNQSPSSSVASEHSASSPNRNYFSPSAEGYIQGYLHASSSSRIGTPNQLHRPPQIPIGPPPNLPPPPPNQIQPPSNYTVGGNISSPTDLNVRSASIGNINSNMEQIWPWMTVVGTYMSFNF